MAEGFFEPRRYDSHVNVRSWTGPDARYGPPQIEVFYGAFPHAFTYSLNEFLARPDVAILGISPAAVSTSDVDQLFAVTVVYQHRLLPNGGEDAEGGES